LSTKLQEAIQERNDSITRSNADKRQLDEVRKSLSQAKYDLITSRRNESRSISEASYHKKHCDSLEKSLKLARNEVTQLKDTNMELQHLNSSLQDELSEGRDNRQNLDVELARCESQIQLLKAQLGTYKTEENSAIQDNNIVRLEGTISNAASTPLLEESTGEDVVSDHESIISEENESVSKTCNGPPFQEKLEAASIDTRDLQLDVALFPMEYKKSRLTGEILCCN
jgi:chromosome segregation ATPase